MSRALTHADGHFDKHKVAVENAAVAAAGRRTAAATAFVVVGGSDSDSERDAKAAPTTTAGSLGSSFIELVDGAVKVSTCYANDCSTAATDLEVNTIARY